MENEKISPSALNVLYEYDKGISKKGSTPDFLLLIEAGFIGWSSNFVRYYVTEKGGKLLHKKRRKISRYIRELQKNNQH